jgi:hypothetical protein
VVAVKEGEEASLCASRTLNTSESEIISGPLDIS